MGAKASEPSRSRPSHSSRTPSTRPSHSPRTPSARPSHDQSQTKSFSSGSGGGDGRYSNSTKSFSGGGTNPTSFSNTSSHASRSSLTSLRESLPENFHIYKSSEIRAATNNFLAKRLSSSSAACWRCELRGKDTVVFQRKFRRKIAADELKERLSVICRSHHGSLINLLGASVSERGGDHIYLVYEYVNGATLANCLRNPKNPSFTVLSNWMSRMQIATDLAHGLDYIHNQTGITIRNLVHNRIKSSSVIVTEPSFNAKICHFGTAQLCGETEEYNNNDEDDSKQENPNTPDQLKRSTSRSVKFEGVRGYMSPEFQSTGIATQKSDVYAFGVVMLELLSGEEPLKYKFDKRRGDFIRTSVIETAEEAIHGGGDDDDDDRRRETRLRRWIDRRVGDSFPVEVAEKLTRVALDCVHSDPDKRPEMGRVANKISKMYIESKIWSDSMRLPLEISVSLAPR